MAKQYILNNEVVTVPDDNLEDFVNGNPDAVEYTGQEITGDLVGEEEEDVVTKLNANYGGQGFSFEQSGFGDNITIKNFDGTLQESFSFDNTSFFGINDNEEKDAKVAAEMNQWMKDNKQPEMNDDNFTDISGSELQEESVGSSGLRVEKNAVKHLNEIYRKKGIWFEEAVAGEDVVRAHKGGKTMDINLPNNWNNTSGDWFDAVNFSAGSDKSLSRWDLAAQQINTFAQRVEGSSKFKDQRSKIQDSIMLFLDDKEEMAKIGANENALYNVKAEKNESIQGEDSKYNEIAKAIKNKFGETGFFGQWAPDINASEISRVEMDHIIEDAVDKKADIKRNSDAVKRYANGIFKLENSRGNTEGYNDTGVKGNTVDDVLNMRKELNFSTMSKEELDLATLVDQWYQLQDKVKNGETVSDDIFEGLESQIDGARKNADNWYTESAGRVDRHGNLLNAVKDRKMQGGYNMTPEEYQAALSNMESEVKTFGAKTKELYDDHQLNMYFSDVKGNEKVDIVINDVWAQRLLAERGYAQTGETPLGRTYNVDYGFLADNISLIDSDGTWSVLNLDGKKTDELKNNKYASDEGYFGLLEFDDEQQLAGATGDYGDIETYTQGMDYSKNFVQDLRTYRNNRKKLIANNYAVNRLYLMNEDPSSRVDSGVEDVADAVHHFGQTIGEAAVNIFDSEYKIETQNQSRQRDLDDLGGVTSYKVVKDSEGKDVAEYSGVELTEKEVKEADKGIGYSVLEGVSAFVPAIVEFAAIEYVTGGLGTAAAATRFGQRMLKTGESLKKFVKVNQVRVGGAGWKEAVLRTGGQGLEYSTQGKVIMQTAKVLNEELKMGIVMGDDYHVGSGAAFYGVGQLLNKVLPATIGSSSRAKTLMDTFKSGTSGMLGIKASDEVHGLIEDLKGNESYMKHISDNYGDYSESGKQALVDFFVFALVGYKGTIDAKGGKMLGMRGRGQLVKLRNEASDNAKSAKTQQQEILAGREVSELTPKERKEHDKLQVEHTKHAELYYGARNRLNIITNNGRAQDPKIMTEEMNKRGENVLKAVDNMRGTDKSKPKTTFKVVEDRKGMVDDGSAAEFVTKDGKTEILIDITQAKYGQIPQEIGHMILSKRFSQEGGKLAAEKMKMELKEALEGFTMRATLKNQKGEFLDKNGKVIEREKFRSDLEFELAKVEKDFSMEDYITNEYSTHEKFEDIKAEEFVMNTLEALADPVNRDKILGGRILDRFSRVMNNQLGKNGFKNGEFNKNMKGKELVEWLGNLSIAMSKGKVTSKQLERFEELLKDPILDQHVNSVGPTAEGRKNSKAKSVSSKGESNFLESMNKSQEKLTNEQRSDKNTKLTKDWIKGNPKELAQRLNELNAQGANLMQNQPEGFRETFNAIAPELKSLQKRNRTRQQLLENNMGTLMTFLYGNKAKGTNGAINPNLIVDSSQKKAIEASAINEALKIIDRYDPARDPEFGRYFKGSLTGSNPKGFQKQGDILKGAGINLNKRFVTESIDDIAIKREIEDTGGGDAYERMATRETMEADLVKELSTLRTLKLSVKQGGFGLKQEQVERIQERLVNKDWYNEDAITVDNMAKDIITEVMGDNITKKVAWAIKGDNWKIMREAPHEQSFEIARPDLAHRVGSGGSAQMSTKNKNTVLKTAFENTGETVSLKVEGSTQNLPKQSRKEFTKEEYLAEVLHTTVDASGQPVSINADSALGKKRKKAYNNVQFEMGRGLTLQLAGDVIKAKQASGDLAIKTTVKDLLTKVQDGKSKYLSSKKQLSFLEAVATSQKDMTLLKLVNGMKENGFAKEQIEEAVAMANKLVAPGIRLKAANEKTFQEFESNEAFRKEYNKEFPDAPLEKIYITGKKGFANTTVAMTPIFQYLYNKGGVLNVKTKNVNYFTDGLMQTHGVKLSKNWNEGYSQGEMVGRHNGYKPATKAALKFNYNTNVRLNRPVNREIADATIISNATTGRSLQKITETKGSNNTKAEAFMKDLEAQYAKHGTNYKDAKLANKNMRVEFAKDLFDYVHLSKDPIKQQAAMQDAYMLVAQQSYLPQGILRATTPITAFTVAKGKIAFQHTVPVLNHSMNMILSLKRSGGNKEAFVKEFKELDANADLFISTDVQQKFNDSVEGGGRTGSRQGEIATRDRILEMVNEYKNLSETFVIDNNGKAMSLGDALVARTSKGKARVMSSKKLEAQIERVQALVEQAGGKKVEKGISVWDFDDTLATTKSSVLFTTPEGKKGKLNAEQYAKEYESLAAKGYKFDFSEFSKVMMGEKGPLFEKAIARNEKFGNDNVYVLTARPANANTAIHEFLKGVGLDVKLENITGLANSTAEAKAGWMVKKVGEGYNDFYFADDAIQNVKAVKNVLEQFDIKSKTQLAIKSMSSKATKDFAEMIERKGGAKAKSKMSEDEASVMGKDKFEPFLPPSAEDFGGLMYKNFGKGKQGEKDMKFIEDKLGRPFEVANRNLNRAKQKIAEDFDMLAKNQPEAMSMLKDKIPGMKHYTYEQAVRSFLFEGAGHKIKSQSEGDRKRLNEIVTSSPELLAFAHNLSKISLQKDGYTKPQQDWLANGIQQDLLSATARGNRALYLDKWIKNKETIFSPENMAKLKALHGPKYVEALETMFWRMENGVNRNQGEDRFVDFATTAMTNSVGAIMWMNTRSATLQMLSTSNFVNWGHNNILEVGKTLANPKQYWSDAAMIFNSNWAKQRRSGLKTDVNHVDLAKATTGKANKPRAAMNWLIQKGFMPTQMADSFAISLGGASYYRNTVKKYIKEGKTKNKAEELAWLDFQGIAEKTQQSSRPDLISQQQASGLGRFVLAFANTPMQYNRIIKKSFLDIKNGRGDIKSNISRIIYYGGMQNLIFSSLQAGLFSVLFSDDDKEAISKKEIRIANSMLDTILRGSGYAGAGLAALKNMLLEFKKQDDKGFNGDHVRTVLAGLSISPPLSSRIRKTYSGLNNYKWKKKVIGEMDYFDIDNPMWSATGNVVEGMTNIPLSRLLNKSSNVKEALSGEHESWKSVALLMGWNRWDLDVENKKLKEAKERVKGQTKAQGIIKSKYTRKYNKTKKEIEETGGLPGHTAFITEDGEVMFVNDMDVATFKQYNPNAELIK